MFKRFFVCTALFLLLAGALFSEEGAILSSSVDTTDSASIRSPEEVGLTIGKTGEDVNFISDHVGIGTTSPAGKLQIDENGVLSATDGNVVIRHPSSGSYSSIVFPSIVNSGSDYGYMAFYDDNDNYNYWGNSGENSALVIGTQNDGMNSVSDVVVLKPSAAAIVDATLIVNGNVGIGTASPTQKLDVNGQIRIRGGSPGAGKLLQSDANGVGSWVEPSSISDGDWTVSGTNMYSAVSGNVGIGTTSPGYKLDVNSGNGAVRIGPNSSYSRSLLLGGWGSGTDEAWIRASNGNLHIDNKDGYGTYINWYTNDVVMLGGNLNMNNHAITDINWASSDDGSGSGLDADLLDGHHWSEIPSIPGDNVTGSGTNNYVSKWTGMHTLGNSIIYDNGNVGIGTTSPNAKLDINADGTSLYFQHPTSGGNSSIYFKSTVNYPSDYGYITYHDDNDSYNYWGNSSENSALVIGVQNDGRNSVSDVVVLKSPASVIVDAPELRAQVMYDNNNTSYYCDPNGNTELYRAWVNHGRYDTYSWQGCALTTPSIEIVADDVDNANDPILVFHDYGKGGPRFRKTDYNLYLEDAYGDFTHNFYINGMPVTVEQALNAGTINSNSIAIPYYNGGTMYLRQHTHWDDISGIDVIGAQGEFRFSSNSGNLNVRADGWMIAHDNMQAPIFYDLNNTGGYIDLSGGYINFPDNMWGGSGDDAYIRYYSEGGENTRLLINISNDADDDLYLQASGPIYLDGAGDYAYYSDNFFVVNPEASSNVVRLGAAWNKPGVYSNGSLYLSSESQVIINDNNGEHWGFDGDNFWSNGWGHIYTTSDNLHLDSYSGEMYLNHYYNNWVNVGDPGSSGYMRVGGFHIYDNNDWAYHTGAPNNRVYFENRVGVRGGISIAGNPWGWSDADCSDCADAINGNPNLWLDSQNRIYFRARTTGTDYQYQFGMYTDGSIYDKEITTQVNYWGYLGSSSRRWWYTYAYYKSAAKPNPFIEGSDVVREDGSQPDAVRNYCTESIKYTVEDWGVGQLTDGVAKVEFYDYTKIWLSPFIKPIVTITPMGECNGLYIAEITPDGFTVKELGSGTSNVKFTWRMAGIRAGEEVMCSVVDPELEKVHSDNKMLRTQNPEKQENREKLIQYTQIMYQEAKKRGFTTALEQLELTDEGEALLQRLEKN